MSIIDELPRIFSKEDGFRISGAGDEYNISKNDLDCLSLLLDNYEKIIIVKWVSKCNEEGSRDGSGTDNLERLKQIADKTGYTIMIEIDVSGIKAYSNTYDMRVLKILSTGKSWYNSIGFNENQEPDNTKILKEFIEKPIEKIQDYIVKSEMDDELFDYFVSKGTTIQQVFMGVMKDIKENKISEGVSEKLKIFLAQTEYKRDIDNAMINKSENLYYIPKKKRTTLKGGRRKRRKTRRHQRNHRK